LQYDLSVLESLTLLIDSLDQAPFHVRNIPTLFYLAETVLYTIRTETLHRPYLTVFEIQLLTVGRLASERIYFHHMAGHLAAFTDLRSHLSNYLDGMLSHQSISSVKLHVFLTLLLPDHIIRSQCMGIFIANTAGSIISHTTVIGIAYLASPDSSDSLGIIIYFLRRKYAAGKAAKWLT